MVILLMVLCMVVLFIRWSCGGALNKVEDGAGSGKGREAPVGNTAPVSEGKGICGSTREHLPSFTISCHIQPNSCKEGEYHD